jgi:hypothetical protein
VRLRPCSDPNSLQLSNIAIIEPNLALEVTVGNGIVVGDVKQAGQRDMAGRPEEPVTDGARTSKVGYPNIVVSVQVDIGRDQISEFDAQWIRWRVEHPVADGRTDRRAGNIAGREQALQRMNASQVGAAMG